MALTKITGEGLGTSINSTNTSGNSTVGLISGTSNSSVINLGDTDASNVGQVKYHHGVNSMVLRTNSTDKVTLDSTGNMLFNQSGTGIYLGTTSATAANLLDDYEEGDYNATITPNTSGTVTLISSINRLVYTKIGRQVTIVGEIGVSSVSSPVGNFKISLPFAVGDFTDSGGRASGSIVVSGSVSANVSDFLIKCFEGESFARVWLGDATSLQSDAAEQLQANTTISIGLTYFV